MPSSPDAQVRSSGAPGASPDARRPTRDARRFSPPPFRGIIIVLAAVAVGLYLGSRSAGDAEHDHAAPADASSRVYRDVAGTIVRLAPDDGFMTVDHEAIPGFMSAMVMDLQLADARELASFSPGDEILFDLAYIGETYQAVRLRTADPAARRAAAEAEARGPVDPLGRGDLVPDISLYDAAGQPFRLRELEPRHKVVTFFYVRCPLQDYCPTQSQRLSRLQHETADSPSGVHLVSLTLDAEFDGPEVLAEYAATFGADPARWTLAGGDDAEAIRDFADRAGARIHRDDAGQTIDHALIGLRVDGDRIVDIVYGIDSIEALVRAM